MTPAQALHDAFWDEGLGSRKPWPAGLPDESKWNALCDRGLNAARILYRDGRRAGELYADTAAALANAYFDIGGMEKPDDLDWHGFKRALTPAARAMIQMSKATSHERRAA